MGIADIIKFISNLFKHNTLKSGDLLPEERILLERISYLNKQDKDITPELYQQLREYEENWLERHYDFNTVEGVNAIPILENLPGAPIPAGSIRGHTGEVYYYLRHKAYTYEENGSADLALACMRKSVALVLCRNYCSTDDCYPLVKMLARLGFAEEAYSKKREIDARLGVKMVDDSIIHAELKRRQEILDFEWIRENLPEKAPKNITGYRRMKTQNTKNYQLLKQLAAEKGHNI